MQAIQNAVRRFLAVSMLLSVKDKVYRMCRQRAPQEIQSSEPTIETVDEPTPYVEEADTEVSFAAWEADRNEKLYRIQDYEQQGLRLLSRAALLRGALQCDDRGETLIAEELREQAKAVGSEYTQVPSDTWDEPRLRMAAADQAPTPRGA